MDSPQRSKWYFLAGGAVAVAATVFLLKRHRSAQADVPSQGTNSTSAGISRPPTRSVTSGGKAGSSAGKLASKSKEPKTVTLDTLQGWAAALRKGGDDSELPTLLDWIEKLLKPGAICPDKVLPACLAALARLVEGHKMPERVIPVALRASEKDREGGLEVLNALFKDRRHRGYPANEEVVALAIKTVREGIDGAATRKVYQRACRLLYFVSACEENHQLLTSQNAPEVLLSAMEKFSDDAGVLLEGTSCLRCIAAKINSNSDMERALAVCLLCLSNHGENGELLWRALALIHALQLAVDGPKAISIAEAACGATTKHPQFDLIVEWTARLLYQLTKGKDRSSKAATSASEVKAWVGDAARKEWLEKFKNLPLRLRKVNKDADHWVAELCRLYGKKSGSTGHSIGK